MLKGLLNKWDQIPKAIKIFFFRTIIVLVIWKVIYLGFLFPNRIIDAPLTQSVGIGTANTVNWLTHSKDYSSNSILATVPTIKGYEVKPVQAIYYHNTNIVSIEDGCNGLELTILYLGFIWCLPAKNTRKLIFTFAGALIIYLVNILRCACMALLYVYHPTYADFTHHYVFTFAVYAFIILLWQLYSKKLTRYA